MQSHGTAVKIVRRRIFGANSSPKDAKKLLGPDVELDVPAEAPAILAQLHMGGDISGIDDQFIASRLGNLEGSVFIDVFLIVGFALGLSLMNKVTRIHMQILGFLCMAAGLALIATGSLLGDDMVFIVTGFILFNTMMNAGPNLATYTIPSEVFPVRLRASGHGLATGAGKLGATAGVLLFPIVQDALGLMATLLIVAGFAILGALVTFLCRVDGENSSSTTATPGERSTLR